jgi:hypothetical protein
MFNNFLWISFVVVEVYSFFSVTLVWTEGLTLAVQMIITGAPPPLFIALGIFKIGPYKLLAWAGFEWQSLWSISPEYVQY